MDYLFGYGTEATVEQKQPAVLQLDACVHWHADSVWFSTEKYDFDGASSIGAHAPIIHQFRSAKRRLFTPVMFSKLSDIHASMTEKLSLVTCHSLLVQGGWCTLLAVEPAHHCLSV